MTRRLLPVVVAFGPAFAPVQGCQPASEKEHSVTQPAATPTAAPATTPDYTLSFRSETGTPYPDGLYQWTSALIVRGGARPAAAMVITRHNGDLIGRPIGLFAAPLAPEKARRLSEGI